VADVGSAGAAASEVSQYTINPVSGQLTPKSPATVAAGRGPVAIAVSPTDHLPAGTAFRSASTASGRCSHPGAGTRGATVTCRLGKLKVGGTLRIQVQVTIKASTGTIRDKAAGVSVTPDPRHSNNTASAATKITR
jgi:hypothetical protein